MSHEANHIYFSYLIPVRIVFCMQHVAVKTILMKHFYVYGVSILVIDPMDSSVLGMMNVKILHGKSFTSYLCSHQIQDALGHNAYSSMTYSLFL